MAVYERDRARIVIRVVYDGPGRAGKTTNVEQLARIFGNKPGNELQVYPAATGRTIFFDWFSFDGGMIDGRQLQVQVVTVPGHKSLDPRRAHILRSADVVVLVCDSAVSGQDSAREMLDSLREHLGKSLPGVPLIVQANKQDLAGAMLPHELGAALGLTYDIPVIGAQASAGIGVRETAIGAIRAAVRQMKRRTARQGLDAIVGEAGTAEQLRAVLQTIEAVNASRGASERPAAEDEVRRVHAGALADEGRVVYIRSHSVVTQLAGSAHGEANTRARASSAKTVPSTMTDRPDSERPHHTAVPVSAMFIDPQPANSPPDVAGVPVGAVPSAIHLPPPPVVARALADEYERSAADASDVLAALNDDASAAFAGHEDAEPSAAYEELADDAEALAPPPDDPAELTTSDHQDGEHDRALATLTDTTAAPHPIGGEHAASSPIDAATSRHDFALADEPSPPASASIDCEADDTPALSPADATTASFELDVDLDVSPLSPDDTDLVAETEPTVSPAEAATSSHDLVAEDEPSLPTPAGLADDPLVADDEPSPLASSDILAADAIPASHDLVADDEPSPAGTVSDLDLVADATLMSHDLVTDDESTPAGAASDFDLLADAAPASHDLVTDDESTPAGAAPEPDLLPADERDVTAHSESAPPIAAPAAALDLPARPGPELPPGHVWPVPGGRAVLERIAGQPLTPIAGPEGHALHNMSFQAAGYRLRTRPEWRFGERERGRAALIDHVRRAARLGPLQPVGIAVALASGDDDHALWHIVPDLPSLGAELRGAAEAERPRHLARLAAAYAAALRLVAREDVALELDPYAFAEQDGRWVYLDDRLREPEQAPALMSALLAPCAELPEPLADAWLAALEQVLPATLTREDVAALGLEDELEAATARLEAEAQQAVTRVRATLARCT
ncbi:GTP-binding protein [Nannocystis radixulma]|uniref:ADP-ribosylation factor-like protein n=1 Tax=Nannocystis radixulma TaxID=2995305 RepID=A0ABT5BKS4_9BACT|nr:ADP-ribosylation factor-like protein [Nannocystis radixulma]MDC0674746.1 ADP-ribosylation factor-like protein [Nannocystis radixulma]